MSFGILDYYAREPSPPPTPKVDLDAVGSLPPKIGTPVVDAGLGKFDFGLGLKVERVDENEGLVLAKTAKEEPAVEVDGSENVQTNGSDVKAGATEDETTIPDVSTPPSPPPKRLQSSEPAKPTYSLFPKDTTPPSRPSITLANRQDSSPPLTNPFHQHPENTYRPRKESLTSSLRSRKDSLTSHRATNHRIPLRILSSASSNYTTPRMSSTRPSVSPPDSSNGTVQSRWSEDTITSPTTAVAPGPRTSFGSLLGAARDSGQYPACFFEDDDDEFVPLRRKLHWGRGASLQQAQQGQMRRGGGDVEATGVKKGSRWRKVLLCGCGG